ncbi:lipoprotein NlpI [Polystyrenella longa]|uniref:Lipoprotein NlpI n=1 Tax=Polystyrenella longa TaxID=2528007 RepID=A0A518CGU7_9PLAN|nr:tetratricopeptide repeat protein [Polystyrenella longa]QDU78447.1 lipoprotein NlpI [Polystyrenella longa]
MRGSTWGILFLGFSLIGCSSESSAPPEANRDSASPSNKVAEYNSERAEPGLLSLGGSDAESVNLSNQHVEEALVQIKAGRLRDGLQRMNLAIASAPGNSNAFFERGKLLDALGQASGAIADYSVAIQLNPTNAQYVNQLGYHYLKRNLLQLAKAQFNRAISLDEQYAVPFNNRALVHIAEKKFDAAVQDLDTALKLDPDYHDALSNKGFTFYQGEHYDQALAVYEEVLEKGPEKDRANIYNNRGLVYYHKRDFEKAIADFSKAIELSPNNPQYFKHRMTTYSKMENKQAEAEQDQKRTAWLTQLSQLNRQIQQSPQNSKNYLARAALFESQTGEEYTQLALTNYEQATKAEPHNVAAFISKAEFYFKKENYEQTVIDCMDALRIDPENREALSLKADAHYELEQFAEASNAYALTGRVDEQVAIAFEKYATELESNGQQAEAKIWKEKANSVDNIENIVEEGEPQTAPLLDPAMIKQE